MTKSKCCVCGTDKFVKFSVLLDNQEYGSLLNNARLDFCDICAEKWNDRMRAEYSKKVKSLVKDIQKEHTNLVKELILKMKNAKAKTVSFRKKGK